MAIKVLSGRFAKGIRGSVPSGYLLGRNDAGDGPVQFISIASVLASVGKTSLAGGVFGTLPVINGGTGVTSITAHGVMIGEGQNPIATVTGSNSQLLVGNTGADPSFTSLSVVLDSLTTTQGSIIYRGAATWAALPPGTSGQFLTTLGAAANPSWTTGSGTTASTGGPGLDKIMDRWPLDLINGGGVSPAASGGGFFSGASGAIGTAAITKLHATTGLFFTPSKNLTVTQLIAHLTPAGTETYKGQISTVSGRTTSDTIGTVLGTTSVLNPGGANTFIGEMSFASPVNITSGTLYFLSVSRADSTTTASARILGSSSSNPSRHKLNAPGTIGTVALASTAFVDSTGLAGGETLAEIGVTAITALIYIEGSLT